MLLLALVDAQTQEIVKIALIVGFVILSLSLHEYAHAWSAHRLGDDTAKSMGRLTPNPIAHIDPVMTVIVPALLFYFTGFVFGGAKPVPIDPRNFKNPMAGFALSAAAGPLANVLLAVIFVVAWRLSIDLGDYRSTQMLPQVLKVSAILNILLALFNLIPIPPLDGSRILMWLLPRGLRPGYARLEGVGIFIVIAVVFMTPLGNHLGATIYSVFGAIDDLVRLILGPVLGGGS